MFLITTETPGLALSSADLASLVSLLPLHGIGAYGGITISKLKTLRSSSKSKSLNSAFIVLFLMKLPLLTPSEKPRIVPLASGGF